MGVEVGKSDGFEVAPAPFEGKPEQNGKFDHGKGDKVSIKFGSHDETSKGDENISSVFSSDAPKDAAEEWPADKRIHTYYFVRYRPYEDPKIKAKLEQADKELQKLNRARAGIVDELKSKRAARSELFDQLEPLKNERKGFNTIFDEKRKEMEPLQQALGKLRSNEGSGARGVGLCSSEGELNNMIYSLQYRIQHESISLNEEKQILKEIKQFEGTREKVIANAAMRAKIKESLGQKDDIQDQVNSMGADLDGVKKERQAISAKINQLSEKVKAIKDEIQSLENDLKIVTEKRDKAFANIQDLRKQRDETNANFYQSRAVLNKARELAAQKNVKDLEALSQAEVDKFMSLWCSKKNFREDYEKRILTSLDARQLSRDGRIRNPEEKPLVTPEAPLSRETAEVAPKAKVKPMKEEDADSAQKTQKATKDTGKAKEAKSKPDHQDTVDDNDDGEDEVYGLGKPKKEEKKEVDAATLKEMRKQEEAAKAKQAMERKKKLAEKAASKAAIRAQKEAEKKEKEREKKAKKKGGVSTNDEAEAEAEEVDDEGPEHGKKEEEAPVEEERKPEKEKPIRSRVRRPRGPETLPRAILKRKKSTNYWLYAAPAAVVVLILLVLGYFYAL
ncbi:PREDICTED: proton pump-interactor 1 isoform X2 [Tarenaya hassleriana]|uniref:proton pump-interactor 1 isoform X2 n=1 Tax=Tarenaya hassleriana TaxID=28532 RepID=UPI00053C6A09|nr:PREDICTED: proton pump-interactor 1 isoform X2 [Tarenaya hassleriana]